MSFSYGNVFLKLWLMKLCICLGICLSSTWFQLRLTFFLFSNLGLIIAQQTSIHSNCFLAGVGHTSCHHILKVHIVAEGPGETPSASRCVSYLIDSFLTDIKQLAETSKGGILHRPMMPMSEAFSVLFLILQKSATQKLLSDQARSLVPKLKLLQRSRIQHRSP